MAIQLSPPPSSRRSPSSLSSIISFLSSHHSDDDSLMESEPLGSEPSETELFETEPDVPGESVLPISSQILYSPPSSSISPSLGSSPSSEVLPLTPITRSPPSLGKYLSQTSSDATQRVLHDPSVSTPSVSPMPSIGSSAMVRAVPTGRGVDCEVINRICDIVERVKDQTDALWDGQLSTNHILDELRQCVPQPQDNAELVERLQCIEDLLNRLADAQAQPREPSPEPSLFNSGSDTLTTIRWLRDQWDRMRRETPTHCANADETMHIFGRHDGRASSPASTSSFHSNSTTTNIRPSKLPTRCLWTTTSKCQPYASHRAASALAIYRPHP
jgi:hypothetical protein